MATSNPFINEQPQSRYVPPVQQSRYTRPNRLQSNDEFEQRTFGRLEPLGRGERVLSSKLKNNVLVREVGVYDTKGKLAGVRTEIYNTRRKISESFYVQPNTPASATSGFTNLEMTKTNYGISYQPPKNDISVSSPKTDAGASFKDFQASFGGYVPKDITPTAKNNMFNYPKSTRQGTTMDVTLQPFFTTEARVETEQRGSIGKYQGFRPFLALNRLETTSTRLYNEVKPIRAIIAGAPAFVEGQGRFLYDSLFGKQIKDFFTTNQEYKPLADIERKINLPVIKLSSPELYKEESIRNLETGKVTTKKVKIMKGIESLPLPSIVSESKYTVEQRPSYAGGYVASALLTMTPSAEKIAGYSSKRGGEIASKGLAEGQPTIKISGAGSRKTLTLAENPDLAIAKANININYKEIPLKGKGYINTDIFISAKTGTIRKMQSYDDLLVITTQKKFEPFSTTKVFKKGILEELYTQNPVLKSEGLKLEKFMDIKILDRIKNTGTGIKIDKYNAFGYKIETLPKGRKYFKGQVITDSRMSLDLTATNSRKMLDKTTAERVIGQTGKGKYIFGKEYGNIETNYPSLKISEKTPELKFELSSELKKDIFKSTRFGAGEISITRSDAIESKIFNRQIKAEITPLETEKTSLFSIESQIRKDIDSQIRIGGYLEPTMKPSFIENLKAKIPSFKKSKSGTLLLRDNVLKEESVLEFVAPRIKAYSQELRLVLPEVTAIERGKYLSVGLLSKLDSRSFTVSQLKSIGLTKSITDIKSREIGQALRLEPVSIGKTYTSSLLKLRPLQKTEQLTETIPRTITTTYDIPVDIPIRNIDIPTLRLPKFPIPNLSSGGGKKTKLKVPPKRTYRPTKTLTQFLFPTAKSMIYKQKGKKSEQTGLLLRG